MDTHHPGNPTYALTDLRLQILANGSILCPRPPNTTSNAGDQINLGAAGGQTAGPHDHLELVVVKRETAASKPALGTTAHAGGAAGKVSDTKKAMSEAKGLWYATLLKRTGSTNSLRVVVKGEGQESVGRAMEVLLEETGKRVDRLMRAYARDI